MKVLKYIFLAFIVIGGIFAVGYFVKSNSKSPVTYNTEKAFYTTIEEKTVATGKVVPEDEVQIKPQISGIIQDIYVEEGDSIVAGALIAKVKVVPNEQTLNSSRGRVQNAQVALNNAEIQYNRNKALFEKGVISLNEWTSISLKKAGS